MTTNEIEEFDLIIVGAGIVGCTAAKAFGKDGRRVLLLERDLSEPDRIVGELLQPGGMDALKTLGLEDCVEGIDGIPCYGYGVIRGDELVEIPYPILPATEKQAMGKSFHHGRLIQKLRKSASCAENVTVKEVTVNELIRDEDKVIGVVAQSKLNEEFKFYAPLTIVCDGIFSKFRKDFTSKTPDVKSYFVGFILTDCQLPLPNHGHVILAKPSPILMYQISTHETRVLVDVPGKLPSISNGDLKNYLKDTVAPQLPETIRIKFLEAIETERLRSMPNGFLPPSLNQTEGMIVLGDAMNIRHPLTGGGMTVAFKDVILLQELLSKEIVPSFTDTNVISYQLKTFHWKRKNYCTAINVLAMSLYRLFAANGNLDLEVLQRGCFAYFQLGGECINGPVGLLSGLIQRPFTLIYHFFAVAFYAIYIQTKKNGWSGAHHSFIMFFTVLYTACVTILPYLLSEIKY
ncbi:squalene epoxidase-domain-containing protein [Cokeromyces recurvatus]|uniref:squalene epoxidase-domain-containing protein n=1 Tax=Cokeromyces recurvatus TaxID=90255 RepID=UPI00221F7B13|nr:squalene epoxidase-domain-containing protein [Cokeromyces recurvatus]KAI7906776.1 squalene epoxidase-domain-containing protein [Cokeromyces recurvatus]